MWQQGFNNKITQTNSGLAGEIPRLGESPHPLRVLHGEKLLSLTARGNSNQTCDVGIDKTLGIYEGVEMLKMQLWPGGDEQFGQIVVVCFHRESRQGRRNKELLIHSFLRSAFLAILNTSKNRSFTFAENWWSCLVDAIGKIE